MLGKIENTSSDIVERQLASRLSAIETAMQGDAVAYVGPISEFGHEVMRTAIEGLHPPGRRTPNPKIVVILETAGGYMESAERMARLFRHHYRRVEFVVPDFAMSAGTILVMSGDEIHMDYSSILGPIDPQVPRPGSGGGEFIPALGYLEQFSRLIQKSARGELTTAELLYMIQSFNPAELYRYEQERELSVELLKQWLVKFKFKNWRTTATHGRTVTRKDRVARAEQIARKLNDTSHWHSHGRGIPMETLRRDLKLLIADFGEDTTLGPAIRDYHRLLRDYMLRLGLNFAWHAREGLHGV